MKILSLFPTYVIQFDTNLDNAELKKNLIPHFNANENESVCISSIDLYKKEFMQNFCSIVRENSLKALKQYGFKEQPLQFRSMWSVIQKKGGFLKQHGHSNSWLTGCYYIEAQEEDEIIFHDPRPRALQLQSEVQERNTFNTPIHKLSATPNRMYIFPSWLEHSTEYVKHESSRMAISWNFKIPESLSSGFGDYG